MTEKDMIANLKKIKSISCGEVTKVNNFLRDTSLDYSAYINCTVPESIANSRSSGNTACCYDLVFPETIKYDDFMKSISEFNRDLWAQEVAILLNGSATSNNILSKAIAVKQQLKLKSSFI